MNVGPQAQALLSLIFSLPFIVLISLPGVSTLFGLIIFFLGIRLAINKGVWLPNRLRAIKIGGPRFYKIFHGVYKIIGWLEKLTRPRWSWVFSGSLSRVLQGTLLAINGLCLALPLPPGTNFPPALAAVSLSLGILEKDGLWVLIGYFLFTANIVFLFFLFWFGKQLLSKILLFS